MPEYKLLRLEIFEDAAYLTLNAPPLNIMTIAMMRELNQALSEVAGDNTLKALVIRAEGKAFSAGADVGEHAPEEAPKLIEAFEALFLKLDALHIPIVAAVQGSALGAGFELAIMADIIAAEETAKLGQPEIKLGFFAPVGVARLSALVGPALAVEITGAGKTYSAKAMQDMGIVRMTVPEGGLGDTVEAVLKDFRGLSPHILRMNLRMVQELQGKPFAEALKTADKVFLDELMKTEDAQEGLAAFLGKRRPDWKNG